MDFTDALISWYKLHARSFPWREEWCGSPYRVLVAELMLKRTRAENVIELFDRFVERYPDVASVANATMQELEGLLAPIGLRRHRGAELKGIAQILVHEYNSQVPCDLDALLSLPGIGQYTAHAVLCFACGYRVPVVDVNVKRILGRYFGIGPNARNTVYWDLAENLLPRDAARFNWALLDLGALVCTAGAPRCGACPVGDACDFAKRG